MKTVQRWFSDRLQDEGLRGRYSPVTVIAGERPPAAVTARLAKADGVAVLVPVRKVADGLWRFDLLPREAPLAGSTQRLVREVRHELPAARVTAESAKLIM